MHLHFPGTHICLVQAHGFYCSSLDEGPLTGIIIIVIVMVIAIIIVIVITIIIMPILATTQSCSHHRRHHHRHNHHAGSCNNESMRQACAFIDSVPSVQQFEVKRVRPCEV